MPARRKLALALAGGVALLAQAAGVQAQSQHPTKGLFGRKANEPAPPDLYRDKLTAEELKLDCRKLSGRMQIRIMQVRAESPRDRASAAASTMQTLTSPLGGTKYGRDQATQVSRDRAWLVAANKQLAAKNCRTYDLDAELRKPASDPPPTLQPKAAAQAPGAAAPTQAAAPAAKK